MALKNLTPHPVVIILDDDHKITIPPAPEGPARLAVKTVSVSSLRVRRPDLDFALAPCSDSGYDGEECSDCIGCASIPMTAQNFGAVQNLPEEEPGVYLIVSHIVQAALPGRGDLLVPAGVIRDDDGVIIGCSSLGGSTRE